MWRDSLTRIFGQPKSLVVEQFPGLDAQPVGDARDIVDGHIAFKDTEFEIYHGDTLLNDWDMLRELNPAKKPTFDAVVANPPFSYRWEPTEAMGDDVV